MNTVLLLLTLCFILRLFTLFISISNEARLRKEGAIEFGKVNSTVLTILHVLFYASSAYESWVCQITLDTISYIGLCVFIFSYIILLYVIYQLRKVWTVKLYIAKEHEINQSFLFRYVKHPNYFLNIIPELIGIGLLCHAWVTMIIILPVYLISLFIRINQEEKAMKHLFLNY
ncbi:MAG: isoprenylcysteine carboxyl methyltransferase family protein [Bacteroidales bacterium]